MRLADGFVRTRQNQSQQLLVSQTWELLLKALFTQQLFVKAIADEIELSRSYAASIAPFYSACPYEAQIMLHMSMLESCPGVHPQKGYKSFLLSPIPNHLDKRSQRGNPWSFSGPGFPLQFPTMLKCESTYVHCNYVKVKCNNDNNLKTTLQFE